MHDDVKILIVDDDEQIGKFLKNVFSSWGMSAKSLTNPTHAADEMKRGVYNVILLDLFMPEMHGMDLLESLVAKWKAIKIIILTGDADRGTAIAALHKGAFDLLEKPISLELLSHALRRALEVQKIERQYHQTLIELQRSQEVVQARTRRLETLNTELMEFSDALSVLAGSISRVKQEAEERVRRQVRSLMIPIMESLGRDKHLAKYEQHLDMLRTYVEDRAFDFAEDVPTMTALSLQELRIAYMIKGGMNIREIAARLYVSPETVKTHRRNIRRKLGLRGTKRNLSAYLQALPKSAVGLR